MSGSEYYGNQGYDQQQQPPNPYGQPPQQQPYGQPQQPYGYPNQQGQPGYPPGGSVNPGAPSPTSPSSSTQSPPYGGGGGPHFDGDSSYGGLTPAPSSSGYGTPSPYSGQYNSVQGGYIPPQQQQYAQFEQPYPQQQQPYYPPQQQQGEPMPPNQMGPYGQPQEQQRGSSADYYGRQLDQDQYGGQQGYQQQGHGGQPQYHDPSIGSAAAGERGFGSTVAGGAAGMYIGKKLGIGKFVGGAAGAALASVLGKNR